MAKRGRPRQKKAEKAVKRPYRRGNHDSAAQEPIRGHVEPKTSFMEEVFQELDALKAICSALDGMNDEAKLRTFHFLKSKYAASWPVDPSY